jgi:hypothetical protein
MMLRHEWGTRRGLRLRTMRGWRLWAAYVILFRIINALHENRARGLWRARFARVIDIDGN